MLDPATRVARARQRRPPAAARDRARRRGELPAGRAAASPLGATRGRAIYEAERFPLPDRRRPSSSTPTGSSSAAASRSTSASSGCARLADGRTRRRDAVRRDRRAAGARRQPADDVAFLAARVAAAAATTCARTLAGDAGQPRADPPPPAPLAAPPRGDRATRPTTSPSPAQEACANAVEHAYAPGPRGVRGRRALEDGRGRRSPCATTASGGRRAGDAPRPRPAADAGADGHGRRPPRPTEGTVVLHQRARQAARHDAARPPRRASGAASIPVARVQGEIDASNVVWVEDAPARAADQPLDGADRRPLGDDLPRQRRHHAAVRARRPSCASTSSSSGSWSPTAPRSRAWCR